MPSVAVIGDLNVDVVARLAGAPVLGSDSAASTTVGGGGAGGNLAAWLAHAGVGAHLVARVGNDEFGRTAVRDLTSAGVTCHVAVDDTTATGVVVVLVGPDGERTMLPDRGANRSLTPSDVPVGLLGRVDHIHVSGYTLLDPATRPAAQHAIAAAARAGVPFSVDPSSWRPLAEAGVDEFIAWTAGAAVCAPNVDEARVLTGCPDPGAAAHDLGRHYGEAVVTCGAEGAVWSDGDSGVRARAEPLVAVDTTGAGDAFTAGWLAARLAGADPAAALVAGNAMGAAAVRRAGARPPRTVST